MKKLVVFLVLLIFLISFVSAGLLGDAWNKITGKVTEENVTPEPGPEPCPTIIGWRIENNKCISDSGCDYDSSKYTYYNTEEECTNQLEPPTPEIKRVCCKIMPVTAEPTLRYEFRLETECGQVVTGESSEIVSDEYCVPEIPPEQCKEGEIKNYICEDGTEVPWCECENGNWICKISPKENCPDVGPEPETCAAKIQITFNKEVYRIGDPVKIMIEIFDFQGNHLPNYAFYGQMYDNMWHTPDLRKTDDKGYFIHTGTAEKPAGGVTEVKFKVYTKETSSCGSVEDIAEVKLELGECGIGGCVPEPECKDKVRKCGGKCPPCPEDDEDGEIFYPCSGCELENKCYPYGYRKAGNYCSDENDVFVEQLGDNEKCENNFECKTNLCINGNCVSSNVWNKFLEWFKKIFGGEGEEPGLEICSKVLIEKDIGDYKYNQTLYGFKEAQVPVYSEDGEQKEIIKCCAAQYLSQEGRENMGMVCPFDSKEDVKNSLRWILAKNTNLVLGEYKGEKVLNDNDKVVAWTSDNYLVASGGDPKVGTPLSEDITDAYLKKYPNDLDLTEDDIPYTPHIPEIEPKSFVFCTEEDNKLAKECHNRGGAAQSDPSTFDGTEESKKKCIESKGFGEGCCEVYTGCIMPDEDCEEIKIVSRDECYWHVARLNQDASLCEKITVSDYKDKCLRDTIITIQDSSTCEKIDNILQRNKCYIHVAEHTGDANICGNIDDSSLREKCHFWVAEQEGSVNVCEEIVDVDLQVMCYVGVAEKTGDASFCDKITDIHIADKCYRDVGIQTNDRSLCEKIIEDKARKKCFDNTS